MEKELSAEKDLFNKIIKNKIKRNENDEHLSFPSIAKEYLKLNRDIKKTSSPSFLINSKREYIDLFISSIEESVFYKYDNDFKLDLKIISKLLNEEAKNYVHEESNKERTKITNSEYLDLMIETLMLKINQKFFTNIQRILDSNKKITFNDVNHLANECFNEILRRNIPLESAKVLLRQNQQDFNEKFNKNYALNLHESEKLLTHAFFYLDLPEKIAAEDHFYIGDNEFIKYTDASFSLNKNGLKYIDNQEKFLEKVKPQSFRTFDPLKSGIYTVDLSKISGYDDHHKIRYLANLLDGESYYFSTLKKNIKSKIYGSHAITINLNTGKQSNFSIAERVPVYSYHRTKTFEKIKEIFLEKYGLYNLREKKEFDSFKEIYDLLNLLDSIANLVPENQLIILWSAMEKIIPNFDGKSIINRTVELNKKAVVLTTTRDDIDNIWNQIRKYPDLIDKIFEDVVSDRTGGVSNYKCDYEKLIYTLINLDKSAQIDLKNTSITLYADIAQFMFNYSSPKKYKEYLINKEKKTKYEFTRIYRKRNLIAHSSIDNDANVIIFNQLLLKYLHKLLSIIISLTLENNNLQIDNILISIDTTYDKYKSMLNELIKEKENFDSYEISSLLLEFEWMFV